LALDVRVGDEKVRTIELVLISRVHLVLLHMLTLKGNE
jgi:hypothetical protein